MKGLIMKDLYILKGTISTTITILTILILYCLLRGYGIGLVIIPTLIFAATTTSSLKLDWAVNWDKKVLTMPISRKSIIRSKYLELVCLCGIGEVVGCGLAYLQNLFCNDLNNYIIINFGLLSLALGIMGGSFHILFAYMFGGKNLENSEILLFLAYGISVGIMAIFLWGIKSTFALDFEKLSIIPILILVLALLVCIWAYKFTVIQYKKKNFNIILEC